MSPAIEEASATLEVGDVNVDVRVLVIADNNLQAIPVLIGQLFMNHPDVLLVINRDKLWVSSKHLSTGS